MQLLLFKLSPLSLFLLYLFLNVLFCSLDIKADIQEAIDNIVKAFSAGDFETLTKLYTDDCRIMAPDTPVQIGKDGKSHTYQIPFTSTHIPSLLEKQNIR